MKYVKFAAAMIAAAIVFSAPAAVAADSILINFSSSHCAPCQMMRPTLAELERSGVPIRHVDVAAEPQCHKGPGDMISGIRKTPTFVVFAGGKEITRLVGTATAAQLRAAIAIDPSGPLIQTGAKSETLANVAPPQTRLAPISQPSTPPTYTSAAAAPASEPMPSLSIADAVERAEAATVRLRVHDGHGFVQWVFLLGHWRVSCVG